MATPGAVAGTGARRLRGDGLPAGELTAVGFPGRLAGPQFFLRHRRHRGGEAMLKFAANLTMLYGEVPFLERFARARASGFGAVEFLFPYEAGLEAVRAALADNGLRVVLFNLPAGDWGRGERGIAILPDRRREFREGVEEAIRYALALGSRQLNCLAGKLPPGLDRQEAAAVLEENVAYAADRLAEHGLTLLVEPINTFDIPGFFLPTPDAALEVLRRVGRPNVRIQFDFYHVQRAQGELIATFRRVRDHVAHVQIADNPGRHQPGTGEIHYPNVFRALEDAGYGGYIGLEYVPEGTTEESLSWLPLEQRRA
jgi:hydroxypyruvate isomerase